MAARYAGGSKAGWLDGHIERVVDALTPDQGQSLDTAARGLTPKKKACIGVINAPPPMPVRPTSMPLPN